MTDFNAHILVCDVVRDDGIHCGNKGGIEVRKKLIKTLVDKGLNSDIKVTSVGCTNQHRSCDNNQCTMIVYSSNSEGTWYKVSPDDIDLFVEEHLVKGNNVSHLVNQEMKVKLRP
jgi:(2Fe-2S) ferredoxin|tara:strand:- start:1693 stop:2037 length:345 start_codon:yes stop_codon:yes gene_type:complete